MVALKQMNRLHLFFLPPFKGVRLKSAKMHCDLMVSLSTDQKQYTQHFIVIVTTVL